MLDYVADFAERLILIIGILTMVVIAVTLPIIAPDWVSFIISGMTVLFVIVFIRITIELW